MEGEMEGKYDIGETFGTLVQCSRSRRWWARREAREVRVFYAPVLRVIRRRHHILILPAIHAHRDPPEDTIGGVVAEEDVLDERINLALLL